MLKNFKRVNDPVQSMLYDFKLFEQNDYCLEYLRKNFPTFDIFKLKENSEIASASFRQANEYYVMAQKSSLNTSSLLYSYALNNLLRGVCYLKLTDDSKLKYFKNHGFSVHSDKLGYNIMDSYTSISDRKGAIHALLELYNKDLQKQDICLYKLLRHIPGLEKFYFETMNSISFIGREAAQNSNEYVFYGCKIDEETRCILKDFHFVCNINGKLNECVGYKSSLCGSLIRDGKFSYDDVHYKNFINFPDSFIEGTKSINISFYCYLLIMTYGMIIRYNPIVWERFIDKRSSKSSTLVEISIFNSVINFYHQMHFLLFDFYYVDNRIDQIDINQIIDNSTKRIMDNVSNKIKNDNISNNSHNPLPW